MRLKVKTRAQKAGPELLVLARWEEFLGSFLQKTCRWPKNLRFTLTQRLENHALDVLEELVQARYERANRQQRLQAINLKIERMRFLLRQARQRSCLSGKSHEECLRQLNDTGKMLHGWKKSLKAEGLGA